jgi:ABC-type glycerol-3-phosphate transport system permease component
VDQTYERVDRPAPVTGTRSWRRLGSRLAFWIPIIALVVWLFVPFLTTLSISLKSQGQVFADPGLIPTQPTLQGYRDVLARPDFRTALVNSALIGLGTCVLSIVLAVPAAYALTRFRFRGRHFLLLFMLIPRLVPGVGIMVPLYRIGAALGALNSRLTLVVVYTGMLLPLAVWLMVGFFQGIPRELEEAANVDGATLWQRLRYVVLPLTVPALITIGVLAFREAWNEFQLVLVLTTSADKRTLPFALYSLQSEGLANLPMESAFALLTILPLILVYLRIERYVVQGITSGSVK